MIKPMTDDEVIAHLTDMADVNYKATDILIKRVNQVKAIKDLLNSNVAQMYFYDKVKEIIEND